MSKLIHVEITGQILGAGFEVWKVLGYGFLESVAYIKTLKEI